MSVYTSINIIDNEDDKDKGEEIKNEYEHVFSRLNKELEREEDLLKKRKEKLNEDLTDISSKLQNEKTIDTFIYNNVDDIIDISEVLVNWVNTIFSFIIIKIIGTIFITLYFIGILEVIGLLNTLGEEILSSINLTIRDKKRETDFYQNYISENLKMPSFDLFFFILIFFWFVYKYIYLSNISDYNTSSKFFYYIFRIKLF